VLRITEGRSARRIVALVSKTAGQFVILTGHGIRTKVEGLLEGEVRHPQV
jgi:hypothetical protein